MYLSYGDRGDDVKKLQQSLISAGYDVGSTGADGIYGQKTQEAVKQYQQAQGIDADGIFGEWTQGRLYGTSSGTQEAAKAPSYKYDASGDEQYQAALKKLQEAESTKAPEYAATYDSQMSDLYNKIVNREKFSYDVNEDALYNQYKDQYTTLGKQAMQDTMGQAAALTGGYDSTYAQSAGQQQYDAYLQQLADVVPDLYDRAYDRYQQEGQDLQTQYSMLGDLRDTEYSRYSDDYNRYMDNLQQLQSREGDLYSRGYNAWQDEQEMSYERQQDAYDKAVNLITTLGYMPSDSELAAAGMSSSEAQRWLAYYQQQMAAASSSGGSSGGSSKSSKKPGSSYTSGFQQRTGSYRNSNVGTAYTSGEYKKFQTQVGMCRTTAGRAALIDDAVNEGKITGTQASETLSKFNISESQFDKLRGYN